MSHSVVLVLVRPEVSIKDWRQQVRTKLCDHPDCAVVVVDVHI